MGTPTHQHSFVRVIVHIVVTGYLNGQALIQVTAILCIQCQRGVFRMAGHEELTPSTGHRHIYTSILRLGKQRQFRNLLYIFPAHFRVAAMRHIEHIIKSTENGMQRLQGTMFKDTEHLLIQCILRHSIMMIEPCLRRPADVERRGDMRTRPVEDFSNLIPISHLLKIHLLYRSTGDNHAIVLFTAHLVEIRIKCFHVFYRSVLGSMAFYLHERDFHLKRSIGKQTHQVRFRCNL